MAGRSNCDSHHHNATFNQILKDVQGFDNPIPLSPLWLLSKQGESKPGVGTWENSSSSNSSYGDCADILKAGGNGEEIHDTQKRKDFCQPFLPEKETSRRGRWRDEERYMNSSLLKDRMDCLTDNFSTRHFGEGRHVLSKRRADSSNNHSNYEQRRESKWDSHWGPYDKQANELREKWMYSVKDANSHLDKMSSLGDDHGKDEKVGDHICPWRCSIQGRRRGELHNQTQSSNKEVSPHSYNRGGGENAHHSFSLGRGRISSGGSNLNIISHSQSQGTLSGKVKGIHGESQHLRYSRSKLLDVYRLGDLRSFRRLVHGVEAPSLTVDEPLEPMALSSRIPEEIISKEQRDQVGFMQSRTKIGRREDLPQGCEDYKNESTAILNDAVEIEDSGSSKESNEVTISKESSVSSVQETTAHLGSTWKVQSPGEPSYVVLHDWRETSTNAKVRPPEISWSHLQKNHKSEWECNLADSSLTKDVAEWESSDDPIIRKGPSGVLDREQDVKTPMQPSPEELQLCYVDPQGIIQGPFVGADIIGWFEAGYFGVDLQVRLAAASNDIPFASLGDVMPHLRGKARPPPGFAVSKPDEFTDTGGRTNSSSVNKILAGLTEVDVIRNESRPKYGATTEAKNTYLKSLMSGIPPLHLIAFSEGQGYIDNNDPSMPRSEVDNLLAKKMALERLRSFPAFYPSCPGRDSASLLSNFSAQSGSDLLHNKMELGHGQGFASPQFPLVTQQQWVQMKNLPSFPNLFPQFVDDTEGIPILDNLLPSSSAQDPQLLNMLQQQYALQLHSQTPVSELQVSLFDKILLLKQQLKQEEQQILLRQQQQQQQQQLLSQVLSEQQNHQHFGELLFGQLEVSAIPKVNVSSDSHIQPSQDLFPFGSDMAVPKVQHDISANLLTISPQVNQNNCCNERFEGSLLSPRYNVAHQEIWGATVAEKVDDGFQKDSLPNLVGSSSLHEGINKEVTEESTLQKSISKSDSLMTKPPGVPSESPLRSEKIIMVPHSELTADTSPLECPGVTSQPVVCASKMHKLADANYVDVQFTSGVEKKIAKEKNTELFIVIGAKNVEACEPIKANEKKSKKQKPSKAQSFGQGKGAKTFSAQRSKLLETDTAVGDVKLDAEAGAVDTIYGLLQHGLKDNGINKFGFAGVESQSIQKIAASTEIYHVESVAVKNTQLHAGQQAWKSAPGYKAKPLLEIQQEEQSRGQTDTLVSEVISTNALSLSTPWAGIVANSDPKISRLAKRGPVVAVSTVGKHENILHAKGKNSQLHDLLAEAVSVKSAERDIDVSANISSMSSPQAATPKSESVDDDNFIKARGTKKSRKKAAKSKGAGSRISASSISAHVPIGSSSAEKVKSSRPTQQEKEVVPAIPSGPSLGDYVFWKGKPATPAPPAWSTETRKSLKTTSLREILKEQEKKISATLHGNNAPTFHESQPSKSTCKSFPSWSLSGSFPSKVSCPKQINFLASQSRHNGDEDLFWGPVDQTKQETKQTYFLSLSDQGSRGVENNPSKGMSSTGSLSCHKSIGGKATKGGSLSSSRVSLHSSLKGKRDDMSKLSEATVFRDWCESECVRLIGTRDTSFLEFCLKQSRSEAEVILTENLGSFDPDHEFIDKFLNYKELLPADVLEMAFQRLNDQIVTGFSAVDAKSNLPSVGDANAGDCSQKGGKKKLKKGKKVSPAVLGFNVVSNRIMMGEIQTVED